MDRLSDSYHHLLGLLARSLRDDQTALDHLEAAIQYSRLAAYRPSLAWPLFDSADTLLKRQGSGDPEKAMSLLDESLAISSELRMRPLMERVLSRREMLGA